VACAVPGRRVRLAGGPSDGPSRAGRPAGRAGRCRAGRCPAAEPGAHPRELGSASPVGPAAPAGEAGIPREPGQDPDRPVVEGSAAEAAQAVSRRPAPGSRRPAPGSPAAAADSGLL